MSCGAAVTRGARRADPAACTGGDPEHRRLAAIHRAHRGLDRLRQGRLAHERELSVEHDARGAAHEARGRGVEADPALHPDGQLHLPREVLQQHERCLGADAPSALGALRDDRVRARRGGRASPLDVRDLHDHAPRSPPRDVGPGHHDDRLDAGRQPRGIPRHALRNTNPEAPLPALRELLESPSRGLRIASEIEHGERPRPRQGEHETGVGMFEGADRDQPVAQLHWPPQLAPRQSLTACPSSVPPECSKAQKARHVSSPGAQSCAHWMSAPHSSFARHLFICAEQLVNKHFSHGPSAATPGHDGHDVAAQSLTSAAAEMPAWLFVRHACAQPSSPAAQPCVHATSAPHVALS
jgi:hypothetical protein